MKKTPTIIDTDMGIDDAVAVALAVSSSEPNIKMISTMFGNVYVEQAAFNALRLLDLFGAADRNIIVAKGSAKPITAKTQKAYHAHGKDGLGGLQFEHDKYTAKNLHKFAKVCDIEESYFELLSQTSEPVTIICIGPMTNLAKVITKYPELVKQWVKQIIFMGGSLEPCPFIDGDYQIPYAEFNINIDPNAVKIVFGSGIPLTMVPMELGHTAFLTSAVIEKGKHISTVGGVFYDIFPQYLDRHIAQPNIATHDMCAVCALTNPEIIKFRKGHLSVISNKKDESAITIDFDKAPNAVIAAEIDAEKVRKLYLEMLKFYK
jgi:non-specific riboncleoside hydrolase